MVKSLQNIISNHPKEKAAASHQDIKVDERELKRKEEFQSILQSHKPEEGMSSQKPSSDVFLSQHATKRLQQRDIKIDGKEYLRLREAFDKLKSKGGKDSLVITKNAAYIVDVNNNKVVTAVDRSSMNENVFTKIDSTVFIN